MGIILGILIGGAFILALNVRLINSARSAGYSQGLKHASQLCRERASTALELAPRGRLQEGLLKCQLARELAEELSAMSRSS